MNVLESILNFLTTLARIIFPRLQRPATGDCPCPNPLPAPAGPPLPADAGDGSHTELHRSDTVVVQQGASGNISACLNPLNIVGYCLMIAGGAGCLLKHLL